MVYTTSEQDIKVEIPGLAQGSAEFPPAIQFYEGWNMIPASSLQPGKDFPRDVDNYLSGLAWTRGYYYNADGTLEGFTPSDAVENDEGVILGRGFLVYLTADGTLVP